MGLGLGERSPVCEGGLCIVQAVALMVAKIDPNIQVVGGLV